MRRHWRHDCDLSNVVRSRWPARHRCQRLNAATTASNSSVVLSADDTLHCGNDIVLAGELFRNVDISRISRNSAQRETYANVIKVSFLDNRWICIFSSVHHFETTPCTHLTNQSLLDCILPNAWVYSLCAELMVLKSRHYVLAAILIYPFIDCCLSNYSHVNTMEIEQLLWLIVD